MKILLATDFSPESYYSLVRVLESVYHAEALTEILILNTFLVHETNPELVIKLNDRLKSESRERLEKLKLEAEELIKNPLVQVQTTSQLGTFRNVISQLVKKNKFDQLAVSKNIAAELAGISPVLKELSCSYLVF